MTDDVEKRFFDVIVKLKEIDPKLTLKFSKNWDMKMMMKTLSL